MTDLALIIGAVFAIILWHELGHLGAAKLLGVGVQEVAVFLGPKILQFRIGHTRYSIRLLPLGGYIDPVDWDDTYHLDKLPEVERAVVKDHRRWLASQPLWERVAIFAAGPAINLATAVLIFLVIGMPSTWSGDVWTVISSVWNAESRGELLGFAQRSGAVHPLDHFSGLATGWELGHAYFLRQVAMLNLGLGLLNLIPLLPLDGGRIVFELITSRMHRGRTSQQIITARKRTHTILVLLSLLGLFVIIGAQCSYRG